MLARDRRPFLVRRRSARHSHRERALWTSPPRLQRCPQPAAHHRPSAAAFDALPLRPASPRADHRPCSDGPRANIRQSPPSGGNLDSRPCSSPRSHRCPCRRGTRSALRRAPATPALPAGMATSNLLPPRPASARTATSTGRQPTLTTPVLIRNGPRNGRRCLGTRPNCSDARRGEPIGVQSRNLLPSPTDTKASAR